MLSSFGQNRIMGHESEVNCQHYFLTNSLFCISIVRQIAAAEPYLRDKAGNQTISFIIFIKVSETNLLESSSGYDVVKTKQLGKCNTCAVIVCDCK